MSGDTKSTSISSGLVPDPTLPDGVTLGPWVLRPEAVEHALHMAEALAGDHRDAEPFVNVRDAIDAALVRYLQRDCHEVDCVDGRIPASECVKCGRTGDYDDPYCSNSKCQSPNLVQSSSPCPTCSDTPEGIERGKVGVECETCGGRGISVCTDPTCLCAEYENPDHRAEHTCPDCIDGLRVEAKR